MEELQTLMVEQLKRRGFYPKEEKEVLLRLGESACIVVGLSGEVRKERETPFR